MICVTLKTYTDEQEMVVVQRVLESEGIPTTVKDAMTSGQVNIHLQVSLENAQRALEIMHEKGYIGEAKISQQALDEILSELLRTRRNATYRYIIILVVFLAVFVYYIFRNS